MDPTDNPRDPKSTQSTQNDEPGASARDESGEDAQQRKEEDRELAREREEEQRERTRDRDERDRERSRERFDRPRRRSQDDRSRRSNERKERVLHTRISEPLAEDIRRIAEELRMPVSNIVRNVLEEAFDVVETVTENVGDLIENVVEDAERGRWSDSFRNAGHARRRHRSRPVREERAAPPVQPASSAPQSEAPPEFSEIVGWQPLILNRNQVCADCESRLDRGERAYAGMSEAGVLSNYLCQDCMDCRR